MFRYLLEGCQEFIDIAHRKVLWTSNGNQLVEKPGQNVEHGAKRCIHKRNNGSSTLVCLFAFRQNVARRSLTSFSDAPRIRAMVLSCQGVHKLRDHGLRANVTWCEDSGVHGCLLDSPKVQTRTEDPRGGCMFVFTMEDGLWKEGA